MSSVDYNPKDWYWSVQDHSPGTQVFSSVVGAYVALADATYVAWLATTDSNGNQHLATPIGTQANLYAVLNTAAVGIFAPTFQLLSMGGSDLALINPLPTVTAVTSTAANKKLKLPQANLADSPPVGGQVVIINGGAQTIVIATVSASALISLLPSCWIILTLTDNTTTDGSWGEVAYGCSNAISFEVPLASGQVPVSPDTSGKYVAKTISGDATLAASGALTLKTNPLSLTGGQLAFPATQSASADANTLDDYEEGTFTPGISFGGGTTGITYTAQTGQYTKIGNLVTINSLVFLSSKGSSTGAALLTGLPFTAGSVVAAVVMFNMNNGAAAEVTQMTGAVTASATTVNLQRFAAGALTNLADTDFNNNSIVRISTSYQV